MAHPVSRSVFMGTTLLPRRRTARICAASHFRTSLKDPRTRPVWIGKADFLPPTPSMFAKINALLVLLFGDLSWAPPPWLLRIDRAASGWMHAHRRATLGSGFSAVAFILGLSGVWQWYEQ